MVNILYLHLLSTWGRINYIDEYALDLCINVEALLDIL